MTRVRAILLLTFTLFTLPRLHAQATYTTGFEPPAFTLGDVDGQNGWGHLSNSPTGGFIEPAPAPAAGFGTQSLAIRTRDVTFFGVTNHLFSPTLSPAAGETGSTAGGVPAATPRSIFSASFRLHTPPSPVISTRLDGRFAELNPSSKGPNAGDPANRYAQVRLFNSTNTAGGRVRIDMNWVTSTGFLAADVALLDWNAWYRFDYRIQLVDGLNGVEPNDRFTLTIVDANGAVVGSACGSTWEVGYKGGGFGGGTTPRAIDGFDFWSVSGPNGALAAFVDELTMTAFDPAAMLGVTISGAATVCDNGTATLTANATIGGAPIATYTWRNASNQVVATTPTFAAPAGTYTVTVTDALCASTTSAPFTVTPFPPLAATITGASSVPTYGATTPLTANATGGSGTISTYTWRDAANQIVAVTPTFTAPAGTYTLTVIDAACGTATSPAFTITQPPPPPVPTAGSVMLGLLVVALGCAAVVRMR